MRPNKKLFFVVRPNLKLLFHSLNDTNEVIIEASQATSASVLDFKLLYDPRHVKNRTSELICAFVFISLFELYNLSS